MTLRISIAVLLGMVVLFPFLITPWLDSITSGASTLSSYEKKIQQLDQPVEKQSKREQHQNEAKCGPGDCAPPRYFATTNSNDKPSYYIEPAEYSSVPLRPWDDFSLAPLDYSRPNAKTLIRDTMESRLNALIESDTLTLGEIPKYLPPQFPQWDRSIHERIASSTILGMPPECCPLTSVHQHLTHNFSTYNVLTEEELNDCECRSPRNYPQHNRSMATLVTAFYQMSGKHPINMYERSARQLLATSDPMIIFCEPNTTWVDFFTEARKHAPTIIVSIPANELRLVKHFPQETFWKAQYEIDPEAPTYHKNVNTLLYVIWDEKLVLLHTSATMNPFNTTQFVWVDTGYWRSPAPHMYRNSAVRINMTEKGVKDESALLFQMIPYNFKRDVVISGNQVLVGGNCFAGTYNGISHLYSAFYATFWAMASTGQFVGSDQKIMYRTCHTYPTACHVHVPRKMRQWLKMLEELLPNIGIEKIGKPLQMKELIAPLQQIPVPPNGIVDDATFQII